jgi:hypothetical protein
MAVQAVLETPQINWGMQIAKVQRTPAIGEQRGLLEAEQQMAEAALAGAVGTEDYRERSEPDRARVLPSFEVPYSQVREHDGKPVLMNSTFCAG